MIKVCFIEDSPIAYDAIKTILQDSPLIDLVGMYSNAESFITEYAFVQPDIVLVDVELPGISGIEAIYTVKQEFPNAKFIVLTIYEQPDIIFKALRAGAGGYLLKKQSFDHLVDSIVLFNEGGAPITPVIASKIIGYFQQDAASKVTVKLTDREKDILELIAEGYLYKEIADKKSITIDGIKKHAGNIYEKLQVRTRSEAIKKYFTQYL